MRFQRGGPMAPPGDAGGSAGDGPGNGQGSGQATGQGTDPMPRWRGQQRPVAGRPDPADKPRRPHCAGDHVGRAPRPARPRLTDGPDALRHTPAWPGEHRAGENGEAVRIHFPPDLPVSARRDDIAKAIRDHQVVIVAGETGSGKTTQLPKICLALGRGDGRRRRMIGHTQPRRIAATQRRRSGSPRSSAPSWARSSATRSGSPTVRRSRAASR